MAATQLSFTLRTSSTVKTVHLLGSWDNYSGQLPLAKDKTSSKSGAWKGTFRFPGTTLSAGQRYWYYYIIDGYHVSHNPSEASTTEPTTGRVLNILDVPADKASKSSKSSSSKSSSSKSSSSSSSREKHSSRSTNSSSSRREARQATTADIPKGRPLSVSQIVAPKPRSPHATKKILESDYVAAAPIYASAATIAELTSRFSETTFDDYSPAPSLSPASSVGSELSDSSSGLSDLSSMSSCSCERYGITRRGDRVKLDCGGSRCGYSDSDSCCDSEEDEHVLSSPRRHGIVVSH